MIDQPKPTTGEWTIESVKKLVGVQALQIDYTRIAKRIADAHNAALAASLADQPAFRQAVESNIKLLQQLAAEREKHERQRQQLKLEHREDIVTAINDQNKLREQLAAAVEALETLNVPIQEQNRIDAALAKIGEKP